ncbi:MAG: hypothetical protein WD557_03440 [Dehalococcoidia bacterium]
MPRTYILSGIVALFAAILIGFALVSSLTGGGGDDDANAGDPDEFGPSEKPDEQVAPEDRKPVNIVMAGSDWTIGENNFVFGITNANDEPVGGAEATVTFYDLSDTKNPKPVATMKAVQSAPGVGPEIVHQHEGGQHIHGGEDENRVGYYVPFDFTHAGFWGVLVDAKLEDGTTGQDNFAFSVAESPRFPAPGEPAIKSDNLTAADVADISEIDSGDPPNDMHDVKIKDAIAAGRPLVIVFSTPEFCTSRFCGPVNEEVEALQDLYEDRIDFVHIEVWADFQARQVNPTMKEWMVQPDGSFAEPFVYLVDKNGIIYDRWEGPVAKNIMEASVKAVAGGATYQQ